MHLGDPDPIGIAITVGYLLASLACLWAALAFPRAELDWQQIVFWLVLAGLYLLLGINKQADLQVLATEMLRSMAREEGWYDRRREYQLLATGVVGAMMAIAIVISLLYVRRWSWPYWTASLAGCLQLTYVGIRLISFHHIDQWLRIDVGSLLLWQVIELSGTVLCILAALAAIRTSRLLPRL